MAFHEELFPPTISYGSRGGPGFNTGVTANSTGQEERIARWESARRRYDVAWGVKTYANLSLIHNFFQARKGAFYAFRYKDWIDYTSAASGTAAPDDEDQTIGQGDGTETDFQLIKVYADASGSSTSPITKPVAGTVLVALDGVAQTLSVDFTVDDTTGIVTFNTAPGGGVTVTAGFEMHWPVRFDESADESIQAALEDFDSGNIQSIGLIEVRDELFALEDAYLGGKFDIADLSGADVTLSPSYRAVRIQATDGTADLILPNPSDVGGLALPEGGPFWCVTNHDLVNGVGVRDHLGALVTTIPLDDSRIICLGGRDNVTPSLKRYTSDAAEDLTPGDLHYPLTLLNQTSALVESIAAAGSVALNPSASAQTVVSRHVSLSGDPATALAWQAGDHSLEVEVLDKGATSVTAFAFLVRVNSAGVWQEEHQDDAGAPGTAILGTGPHVFDWTGVTWGSPAAGDRLVVEIGFAVGGGVGNQVEYQVNDATAEYVGAVTDVVQLKQWLVF